MCWLWDPLHGTFLLVPVNPRLGYSPQAKGILKLLLLHPLNLCQHLSSLFFLPASYSGTFPGAPGPQTLSSSCALLSAVGSSQLSHPVRLLPSLSSVGTDNQLVPVLPLLC
jgi:hypothetical protein